jgi:hypothetical protein
MVATALLRSWIRRAALGGAVLAVAGLVLRVLSGSPSASQPA